MADSLNKLRRCLEAHDYEISLLTDTELFLGKERFDRQRTKLVQQLQTLQERQEKQ